MRSPSPNGSWASIHAGAGDVAHGERAASRCCSPGEHWSQRHKTHFIKEAETTTAGRGEAGRWSHRAGHRRGWAPAYEPTAAEEAVPAYPSKKAYFGIFLPICAELSVCRWVASSAQPLAAPLPSALQCGFVCARCAGEAVGVLFFASKSVDSLPFFKSVNSCNRSHQLAQANRAKVLPSSSPTAYCEENCALLLRRLLERLWSWAVPLPPCICSRTDSSLDAREAGWAFSTGTGTTGARPAQQQQQRKAIFFPLSVPESLPGLREVARGCLVFFKHRSPFPVFKKLQREAPPAALLNYPDLWRG